MIVRLYHGSPEESFVPTFGKGNDQHDYGRGFYLTENPDLAKEWSVSAHPIGLGWMHVYDLDLDGLRVFDFTEQDPLVWLAELMKHREADDSRYYRENSVKFVAKYGVDVSSYDVIRGWRANASYFFICKSFVRNNIGVDFLRELLTLGNLGIQYFLQTPRAFAALKEDAKAKAPVSAEDYFGKYNKRDSAAREKMYELVEADPRNVLKRTFKDLI